MCSTPCKIRSTHCKICSTKQSYPQVIPRVIHKKVLLPAKYAVPHAKYAVLPAKYAVPTAKHAVPPAKYAVQNKVIPKLSPELSPKRCYTHAKYAVPTAKYTVPHAKYAVPPAKHAVPHAKYAVATCKICSIKQSYPQVIPRVIPNGSVEEKWT